MFDQAGLGIAKRVHDEEINEYPLDVRSDYLRVSYWVRELIERYAQRGVVVRIVDPMSLVGMYKSIRHGIWHYPTVLVNGTKRVGWDKEPVDSLIEQHLAERGAAFA